MAARKRRVDGTKKVSCPAGKWVVYQGGGVNRGVRGCYGSKAGARGAVKRLKESGRDPGASVFFVMKGPFTGTSAMWGSRRGGGTYRCKITRGRSGRLMRAGCEKGKL
jgi:hypothetical protein